MSYAMGIKIVGTTQQSNLACQYVISGTCVIVNVVFVSFLSTASLSIRRKKVYHLASQLLVKASNQRKIRKLFILRKLIKILGDLDRPTICLTDRSGEESEPFELLQFVFNTFS